MCNLVQVSSIFADEPEAHVNKYKVRPVNNPEPPVHNFPVYTQQKFGGQPTWQGNSYNNTAKYIKPP